MESEYHNTYNLLITIHLTLKQKQRCPCSSTNVDLPYSNCPLSLVPYFSHAEMIQTAKFKTLFTLLNNKHKFKSLDAYVLIKEGRCLCVFRTTIYNLSTYQLIKKKKYISVSFTKTFKRIKTFHMTRKYKSYGTINSTSKNNAKSHWLVFQWQSQSRNN